MRFKNTVITHNNSGHTLHHNRVFSHDGQWAVFDCRNDDSKIGETSEIGVVNIYNSELKIVYQTKNPCIYGPGVGAASFHPSANKIIFIHGLTDANKDKPYSINRRTGIGVDLDQNNLVFNYDARAVQAPYCSGSLRGGTHSHAWSEDGMLISFTYNDEFVEPELRTVGVLIPTNEPIKVDNISGNNNGSMYAAIVAEVNANPQPCTNEINKAFDECWVGENGYLNHKGNHIQYAIAFQGNTLNKYGEAITEIFIVDIHPDLIVADKNAIGLKGQRPQVPKGISQRRLTFTKKGLSHTRHWLRSSPNGQTIYALAIDEDNLNQIIAFDINTGKSKWITQHHDSIDFTFNLSPNGSEVAFVAGNKIWLQEINNTFKKDISTTSFEKRIVGAPIFSPDGKHIIYNAYLKNSLNEEYIQIIRIDL